MQKLQQHTCKNSVDDKKIYPLMILKQVLRFSELSSAKIIIKKKTN